MSMQEASRKLNKAAERVRDSAKNLKDDVRGAVHNLRAIRPRPIQNRKTRFMEKPLLKRLRGKLG